MAHEIEERNGRHSIAYAGEEPWHGLGKRVPADLTPDQMLEAADLNWSVAKVPVYADVDDDVVEIPGRCALVRDVDRTVLDVVSNDWNPVQNSEAFEFFNDFIAAGDMEMHTAGSLKGGTVVWALARVMDSFEVFGGDRVDAYLLFTNYHKYGFSTDVRFTPIRVVCNNTLTLSLGQRVERMVKYSHRRQFDADRVKETLGVTRDALTRYRETATFLGSHRYDSGSLSEYFERLFPSQTEGRASRNAERAELIVGSQPGHEYAEGTWWSAFNAVTYMVDHELGRTRETALYSSWYGVNRELKNRALEMAVDYAGMST
jgi:phage/plasmid-like protein (TIGR03299 family)